MKTDPPIRSRVAPFCAAIAGLFIFSASAQAGFILTLQQVGSDVVATGSGALNVSGLSLSNAGFISSARMNPSSDLIALNGGFDRELFSIAGPPQTFGTGGFTFASSSSGSTVGLLNGSTIIVPQGYVNDTSLSGTSTYTAATFASLGLTPGIYQWTWGAAGPDQNFTVDIEAVPEPGTWAASVLAAGTILYLACRRHTQRLRSAQSA
jgi:hypothetical protein